MADIKRAYSLFNDEKRSCQFLVEYQNEFMFNEAVSREEGSDDGDANNEGEEAEAQTTAAAGEKEKTDMETE